MEISCQVCSLIAAFQGAEMTKRGHIFSKNFVQKEAQMLAALKLEVGALSACICHTAFDQAYEVYILTTGNFLMQTVFIK